MELIEGGIPVPSRSIFHRSRSWDNRRVRTKTRAVVDLLPLGFFVLASALIAFAARVTGPPYFGTDPAVVASLGVGALATAAVGHATGGKSLCCLTIDCWPGGRRGYLILLGLAGLPTRLWGRAGGWVDISTPDGVCRHRIGARRGHAGSTAQAAGRWLSRSPSLRFSSRLRSRSRMWGLPSKAYRRSLTCLVRSRPRPCHWSSCGWLPCCSLRRC
jgi:hypothetical protein